MGDTDEELLIAIPNDRTAFTAFYRRHSREVLGFLQRRTDNPELAADITAEVFATVLLQAKRFDPCRGDARGWLFAIVRHKQVDAYRQARAEDSARRKLRMRAVPVDESDVAMIAVLGSAVETLVNELPDDQRVAVSGRVVDDLAYEDLARRHSVTQATMRQRVARGLSTIRARMEER